MGLLAGGAGGGFLAGREYPPEESGSWGLYSGLQLRA